VGEHLEYLAFSHGLVLACLGWCSAPRHIGCRDRYLGWTPEQRVNNLCRVVINTRFLILPWVNAYNKAPVQIQYCYAHLLRDVEKIEKDFPDSPEVKSFVSLLAPLLSQAMHLRSQPLSDEQYCREAKEIQKKLIEIIEGPAQHLAIRAMQDLFRTHEHRLYHWVQDRQVPPDNNLAERDLRPTVIARKVSFGSSSDAGSKTRSILMSVLHTLNKRRKDQPLESILKNLLDEIAKNPTVQIASLFPLPKSITRN
jgi:transposase